MPDLDPEQLKCITGDNGDTSQASPGSPRTRDPWCTMYIPFILVLLLLCPSCSHHCTALPVHTLTAHLRSRANMGVHITSAHCISTRTTKESTLNGMGTKMWILTVMMCLTMHILRTLLVRALVCCQIMTQGAHYRRG